VLKSSWKRHLSYGSVVSLIMLGILVWIQNWQSFEVNIARDRQALYRVNYDGVVENTFVLKIRNKSNQKQSYTINIKGLGNAKIKGPTTVNVLPSELKIATIIVTVDKQLSEFKNNISFDILKESNTELVVINTSFYSNGS
jgi:polyferredoxin